MTSPATEIQHLPWCTDHFFGEENWCRTVVVLVDDIDTVKIEMDGDQPGERITFEASDGLSVAGAARWPACCGVSRTSRKGRPGHERRGTHFCVPPRGEEMTVTYVVWDRRQRGPVAEGFPTREAARRHLLTVFGGNPRLQVRRVP